MHARSDLTLPCYCSAAAKNRSACADCSAAANSRFACTELLPSPGLPTDRAHARFELEPPCYCSSVAAKSRFACTELLSVPALPTERVHARCWVETTPPPFGCCDISLFLHGTARSAAGFSNPKLFGIYVGRAKCDVSDTLTSLDSVVAASNRTGACPI